MQPRQTPWEYRVPEILPGRKNLRGTLEAIVNKTAARFDGLMGQVAERMDTVSEKGALNGAIIMIKMYKRDAIHSLRSGTQHEFYGLTSAASDSYFAASSAETSARRTAIFCRQIP